MSFLDTLDGGWDDEFPEELGRAPRETENAHFGAYGFAGTQIENSRIIMRELIEKGRAYASRTYDDEVVGQYGN